jgi:hypothetical protein
MVFVWCRVSVWLRAAAFAALVFYFDSFALS